MRFSFHFFLYLLLQMQSLLALPEKYQLINLGLLEYEGSEVESINNQSQICGYFLKKGSIYLFAWDKEKGYNYAAARLSHRLVITDEEEIYGTRWNREKRGLWELDQETLFKWANPFSYFTYFHFADLGYPVSLQSTGYVERRSSFWDVNDLGQILIMNQNAINRKLRYEIWIYENDQFKRIKSPHIHAAIRINNQSKLLGYLFFDEINLATQEKIKKMKSVVYDLNEGTYEDLPFKEEAKAIDMNDQGEIVGWFLDSNTYKLQGFFGCPQGPIALIEHFVPSAVNNNGEVIGNFFDQATDQKKPSIWKEGFLKHLADMTDLIDDKQQEWSSLDALIDINDKGEIIGQGTYQGRTHGFLLVPLE